ncbi:MAG: tyrosine-type recombinase/integrase [Thermoleophilia bacterium]
MTTRITGHVRRRRYRDKATGEWHEGAWEYRIELGKAGAARRRVERGGFRTRKLAEAALREELRAREAGTYVARSSLTVESYFAERWLPWLSERTKNPVRATTADLYARALRLYIAPHIGKTPLQELGPADVDALYVSLAKGDPEAGRKPLGAHALHNVATVLHGGLEQAVRWELLSRNPATKAAAPERKQSPEAAHWSPEQVGAFLDWADVALTAERHIPVTFARKGKTYGYQRTVSADPMQRALWYVVANTGMRRGEVCGLRWSHVDLHSGLLRIEHARVQAGGRVVDSGPKTARGLRTVALDASTVDVLREWQSTQRRERLRFGTSWEDTEGHVFTQNVLFTEPTRYGVPVAPRWVTEAFTRAVQEAGLPPITVHGLRHSWATAALEAGEHLRAVADHLGHSDTSVTDRTYTHSVRRVQDTTALRVAALIASKRGAARNVGGQTGGKE